MATASEVWDPAHRSLTIGLLATVAFTAFEALAVATALPTAVAEIGGLELYGWAFSAFMLASLVGITGGGVLADRHGPAPPFLQGALLFVAGLLAAGAAPTMPLLVVARAVQGLGSGAIGSVSYVAVGRGYSAEARPRMIALLSSAWVIPGLVGPAISGGTTDLLGWRWVFWGLAPATAIGATTAFPAMRRLAPAEKTASSNTDDAVRIRDAVALALGAGLVMAGLEGASGVTVGGLALVGLVLAGPAARRLLPPGTLRARPGPAAAVALVGLTGFAFFGAEAFVPLALTAVRGQTATVAGLPLTVGTLTWATGSWIQAREANQRSRRGLVRTGFLVIGAGVATTAAILRPEVPVWAAGATWGATSLGMGLTYSTLTLVILESARDGEEGRASSSLQLSYTLGIALGTGVGGAIVGLATRSSRNLADGIVIVDAAMVLATALAVVLAAGLPHSRRAVDGCKRPRPVYPSQEWSD